jgi:hypothetical protein
MERNVSIGLCVLILDCCTMHRRMLQIEGSASITAHIVAVEKYHTIIYLDHFIVCTYGLVNNRLYLGVMSLCVILCSTS